MKRTGFRPPFAAAVEAVASTGGQIMPPVMGAAAFVMAEFLVVPYAQVALWALIPAVLYYVAVFFAVHFEAKRYGLAGVPKSQLPRFWHVMRGARPPVRPDHGRAHRADPGLLGAAVRARGGAVLPAGGAAARQHARRHPLVERAGGAGRRRARTRSPWPWRAPAPGIVIGVVTITGLGIVFTQLVIALAQNSLLLALDPHRDGGHRARAWACRPPRPTS